MKEFLKRFFGPQQTEEEVAEENRIAKEENDQMLGEAHHAWVKRHNEKAAVTPGATPINPTQGIDITVSDANGKIGTFQINQATGDIIRGDISTNIRGDKISIADPPPPGNFDGFNKVVGQMEAEDNPEETRYFLIKNLYYFTDPNLEPLEAVLYDKEGNVLAKRSIMETDLILSFQVEEVPKEGLDLILKILIAFEDHQIIQNQFPVSFAQTYTREYDRIGKFPSNPETKRIVLDLAFDSKYQEWVERIKPMELFLEGHYRNLEINSGDVSISNINSSAGGISGSVIPVVSAISAAHSHSWPKSRGLTKPPA